MRNLIFFIAATFHREDASHYLLEPKPMRIELKIGSKEEFVDQVGTFLGGRFFF